MFDRQEVEREFQRYFMTGPVLEDWRAWAHLFTDDATYLDHFYGTFTGPEEINTFLEGTMGAAPQVYSPLVWYILDGTRVAYKVFNRAPRQSGAGRAPRERGIRCFRTEVESVLGTRSPSALGHPWPAAAGVLARPKVAEQSPSVVR